MAVSQTQMTVEEFLKLPEEKPALEFEDGMVSQKVSPKAKHSRLQLFLGGRLNDIAEPRKVAFAFTELRASFGGRSYVPDVAVIRWDRVPFDEVGEFADDIVEPPDIAVEIASPSQSVTALVRRCVWYVENGVRIALLVDPADRSVVRFRPGQNPVVLTGDDVIALDGVLDDFALTVRELFDSLRIR
ncbi:MAG: Uma2 family endonuclease [Chloroflexota bacterium]|nr:Uma2 family endonuclease [Chloroflexota bacterium]